MKRLITFLSTMLLLLMLVPSTCLAFESVTFVSSDGSLNGKLLTKQSENEFTYELDMTGKTGDVTFKFNVSNGVGNVGWYDDEYQNITDFSGSKQYWCANRNNAQDFILKHSNSPYKKYTLILNWDNDGGDGKRYWRLTVKGYNDSSEGQITFYVSGNNNTKVYAFDHTDSNKEYFGGWPGLKLSDYPKGFSSNVIVTTFNDANGTGWYKVTVIGTNDLTIVLNNKDGSLKTTDIMVEDGKSYKYDYNNDGGYYTKGNTPVPGELFLTDYYLIVPADNVGNTTRAVPDNEVNMPAKHKAFRFQRGRQRDSKNLINDLTSLTLKIDGENGEQLRYDENGQIKFYIQDAAGNNYFQAPNDEGEYCIRGYQSNTNKNGSYGITSENGVDGCAVRSHEMSNTQTSQKYYVIKKDEANSHNGETKSLTFMFSRYNESSRNAIDNFNHTGNLIVGFLKTRGIGSDYYNKHIKDKQIYIVGSLSGDKYMNGSNTTNQNPSDDQEPYYDKDKYRMERNLWKDGEIRNDISVEEADSIVYSREVKRGEASWNNFFLSFTTTDKLGHPNDRDKDNMWNPMLRPYVQDQMDGQALEGGIFYFRDDNGTDNQQQSLNPLLTEEQKERYVSYRVYFNATYSTYRIEFFDNFYIAGPAVKESGNLATRIPMQKTSVLGHECYVYTGEFERDKDFAFFVNEETYTNNYSEDNNASHVQDNCNNPWTVQAPTAEDEDKDYPFYNHVRWNTSGDNAAKSLGTGNNAIKWTLPNGRYTLRFYNHKEASDNNQLYTIDKSVKIKNVTSCGKNYNGWMPFSDDCALVLPEGIKAYYAYDVKEETDGKKIVQLRELRGGYVPANCGVLLRNEKLTEKDAVERLNYMPVPTGYTKSFEDYKSEQGISDNNLLMDCSTTDKCVALDQVKDGFYNYYFSTSYKQGGTTMPVPLNFWKVLPNSKPNKNSTYLHVQKQVTPLAFNVTDGNFYIENDAKVESNAKGAYCLFFSIDDVDNSEVTGIRVIRPEAGNNENDNIWYNMQGMRVAKPTTAGIYINNGKKVVIK